jgi:hypothetical protein
MFENLLNYHVQCIKKMELKIVLEILLEDIYKKV